jgi:hypothetical protein
MQAQELLLCLGSVFTAFCVSGQGTFQNLDFEQGKLNFLPGGGDLIATTNALPGWAVYANGAPQPSVSYNEIVNGAVAGLMGTNGASPLLDGKFSAILGGPYVSSLPLSMSQSAVIPIGSQSLRYLQIGFFSVSFAGHALPIQLLGNGPRFGQIYGADVSQYAGQYGQLTFQTGALSNPVDNLLDDITFSTQPIPEPGVLAILGLGTLMLSLRRDGSQDRRRMTNPKGPVLNDKACVQVD